VESIYALKKRASRDIDRNIYGKEKTKTRTPLAVGIAIIIQRLKPLAFFRYAYVGNT
jgi:hypothetical protein